MAHKLYRKIGIITNKSDSNRIHNIINIVENIPFRNHKIKINLIIDLKKFSDIIINFVNITINTTTI